MATLRTAIGASVRQKLRYRLFGGGQFQPQRRGFVVLIEIAGCPSRDRKGIAHCIRPITAHCIQHTSTGRNPAERFAIIWIRRNSIKKPRDKILQPVRETAFGQLPTVQRNPDHNRPLLKQPVPAIGIQGLPPEKFIRHITMPIPIGVQIQPPLSVHGIGVCEPFERVRLLRHRCQQAGHGSA